MSSTFLVRGDSRSGEPGGRGHGRRVWKPKVVGSDLELRREQRRPGEPLRQRHGTEPLILPQPDAADEHPARGRSPELPGFTELARSHLLPTPEQRTLARRRATARAGGLGHVTYGARRGHQTGGEFHLRLPATTAVLVVRWPMGGWDRRCKIAYPLRFGPCRWKILLAEESRKTIIAEFARRQHRDSEVERALDLRVPESVPVLIVWVLNTDRPRSRTAPASRRHPACAASRQARRKPSDSAPRAPHGTTATKRCGSDGAMRASGNGRATRSPSPASVLSHKSTSGAPRKAG